MTLDDVLKYYGGINKSPRKVAEALGLTSSCVYGWKEKGYIPMQSQILIELHSKGRFKRDKAK